MNLSKFCKLFNVASLTTATLASFGLALNKAEASTLTGFVVSNANINVQVNYALTAHPGANASSMINLAPNAPLASSVTLGPDSHGTTGTGSLIGNWLTNGLGDFGLAWTLSADIFPGTANNLPVSFTSTAIFNGLSNTTTANGIETIPEPSSIVGLLAIGTLGAGVTLNRKLKPSKSIENETTKVS